MRGELCFDTRVHTCVVFPDYCRGVVFDTEVPHMPQAFGQFSRLLPAKKRLDTSIKSSPPEVLKAATAAFSMPLIPPDWWACLQGETLPYHCLVSSAAAITATPAVERYATLT